MRALTLIQPWATYIAHYGKDVENRTWPPPRSIMGQRIAIHAGKRFDAGAIPPPLLADRDESLRLKMADLRADDVPRGAIIATAIVSGIALSPTEYGSPWKVPGQWGWQLLDVVALPEPIPCKGRQGLWEVPAEIVARIEASR